MKHVRLLMLLAFLFPVACFSQLRLDISVSDLKNNEGKLMLQLFDENENVINQVSLAIKNNQCQISIPDLKPGKYAVRYYHDENQNGIMETNKVGKPTEGYGFSNNVTGKFGPPPFEKWLFELNSDKSIALKPVY